MDMQYFEKAGASNSPAFLEVLEAFCEYFGEDRIDVQNNTEIIIYFPQITVTNSAKDSRILYDFYVKVDWSVRFPDRIGFAGIKYLKATYSIEEALAGHVHSHAQSAENFGLNMHMLYIKKKSKLAEFKYVCLGGDTTPINITINQLNASITPDLLLQFCMDIDHTIRWESLEGGPMSHLRNIKSKAVGQLHKAGELTINSLIFVINKKKYTVEHLSTLIAREIIVEYKNHLNGIPTYIDFSKININFNFDLLSIETCSFSSFVHINSIELDYLIVTILNHYSLSSILSTLLVTQIKDKYTYPSKHLFKITGISDKTPETFLFNFRGKPQYVKVYGATNHVNNAAASENLMIFPPFKDLLLIVLKNLLKAHAQ